MKKTIEILFGRKIGNTRIVPVMTKILFIFLVIIMVSNLSSNYINLILHRSELIKQIKEVLVKDLANIYFFCSNQYGIYDLTKNKQSSVQSIIHKSLTTLKRKKSIALGIYPDSSFLFQASKLEKQNYFTDQKALSTMKENLKNNISEGFLPILFLEEEYFATYKYHSQWDTFIIRAEEKNEFYHKQKVIFWIVTAVIIIITLTSIIIGIFLLSHILRFVGVITNSIIKMLNAKTLDTIDLKGGSNDDITFLGMAFNSLSTTVNNLISIFRKFANQDVVTKAYTEHEVKLEGVKRELSIVFSDIKNFTFITEVLGSDIINLLNLYYDRTIREIMHHGGVIGSIIGDALLAVFGVLDEYKYSTISNNKSYQAIMAAYKMQDLTEEFRKEMKQRKKDLMHNRINKLTPSEEKIYKATLIEVGVGIDGGEVFYGTLGSNVRMTNTVIGDNVNAASRLEGLTRIYNVPILCSQYIVDDVNKNVKDHNIHFIEIDTVQVKGKTEGKKVFWPILESLMTEEFEKDFILFSLGLQAYYKGNWAIAQKHFKKCKHNVKNIFLNRLTEKKPANWNGIWQITTK